MAPLGQETSLKCLRVKRIALSWFVSGLIAWDISNLVSQGHSSLIDAQGSCWKLRVMAKIRLLDSGKCCCFKANFILPAAGTELDPAQVNLIVQILDLYRRWGCLQPLIASEARRTVGTARTAWRSGYEFGAVRSVLAHLEESLLTDVSRISGSRKHLPQWREVMINVRLGVLLSEGLLNAPAWSDLRHARLMTECWINDHHGNVRKTSAILWYLPL